MDRTTLIMLLVPLALIQVGLAIAALLDLVRREGTRGPKWLWVLIILLVNFFGPVIYFLFGREE